ncbi:hypothetical protein SEA_WEASELS2_271 [Rhodococcus phage Weasels2]|uniref:Uncharacterized protein n=1 Tax=Rhodococcus phage Weasels2 TaxID=1897437 RepID=A0A1I9SAP3_9CAUD|nr:hypothetical protein FDH04_gp145 [Rhodococcus phage Weasels2]AOZ63849.1 hypothetical protein SEA_WEASELS2_271 [Rhodococcus phage Weasels2]
MYPYSRFDLLRFRHVEDCISQSELQELDVMLSTYSVSLLKVDNDIYPTRPLWRTTKVPTYSEALSKVITRLSQRI